MCALSVTAEISLPPVLFGNRAILPFLVNLALKVVTLPYDSFQEVDQIPLQIRYKYELARDTHSLIGDDDDCLVLICNM